MMQPTLHGGNLSMTGSMMGPPGNPGIMHPNLQPQQSIISHSSMSMNRPMYKTNSIMRGGPPNNSHSGMYPMQSSVSRNDSIDQIGSQFSRSFYN
jgi:hypothetical protein